MDLIDQFYQNLYNTSILEFIAVLTGIGSVWYAKKENILVYPVGIVSVLIYVYICFNARLYADAGINFFYFVMSVFGWYNWTRKTSNTGILQITANTPRQQAIYIVATMVSFIAIISLIWVFNWNDQAYMTSYVPWIDSVTTSIFLVGMLLMALKRIENWMYWIIGDTISIPLYFTKGLVFTSVLYSVLLIIAIMGYLEWKKRLQREQLAVLQ
jgi:nicotinamide mononucleotide transporter